MASQLQIKFLTKQSEYAIPDTIFTVEETVTTDDLNSLIKSILEESNNDTTEEFDFLALGEIIRTPLGEHVKSRDGSVEDVHEIEYFIKFPAPSPENCLNHDDWVSGVDTIDTWILSGCYDNTVHIWNTNGEHRLTIPGHSAPVKSVSWLKNDADHYTLISTSFDETAIQWQWNSSSNAVDCIHVCKGHTASVDCIAVNSKQNKFVTGSYDQMLKLWSANDDTDNISGDEDRKRFKSDTQSKVKTPLMTLSGHRDGISGVEWTDSSEVVTSGLDSTLKIWDLELGGLKHQLNGSKAFLGLSYSPLSRLIVTGSSDRHIRLWDPRCKDGTLVKSVFSSHNLWVTSLDWSPVDEHKFVSCSMDTMVKLWDTRSPKASLFDISAHEDKVFAVNWSRSSFIVSGGADNHVKLYKFQESMEI